MAWSYSARLIAEHLQAVGGFKFVAHSSRLGGMSFCDTGLRVSFYTDAGKVFVSVQTSPAVAGQAFAKTALMSETGILESEELGYDDPCLRHGTPEELFEHLGALKAAIERATEAKDAAFFERLFAREEPAAPVG